MEIICKLCGNVLINPSIFSGLPEGDMERVKKVLRAMREVVPDEAILRDSLVGMIGGLLFVHYSRSHKDKLREILASLELRG